MPESQDQPFWARLIANPPALDQVHAHLWTLPETACAAYQHQTGAETTATYPVAVLVQAILVNALDALSYRALEERL